MFVAQDTRGGKNPPMVFPLPLKLNSSSPLVPILFGAAFVLASILVFVFILRAGGKEHSFPLSATAVSSMLTYPTSRRVDASDTYFGVKVEDPYRWLEDGKSPEVQAWLAHRTSWRAATLMPCPAARRWKSGTPTAPHRHDQRAGPGGRPLLLHEAEGERGKGGPLLAARRPIPLAPEHVLIDPNQFIGDK